MQGHLIDGGGPVCLGSNRRLLNEASAGERRYLQQGADAGGTREPASLAGCIHCVRSHQSGAAPASPSP